MPQHSFPQRLRPIALLGAFGLLGLIAPGCGLWQDAPPTVTPIFITATPLLPIVPIVATETPLPTSVLAPTSAALLPTQAPRTATPTPPPVITRTPTFTPTTTNTPITPGAVAFVPVGGVSGPANVGGSGCANVPQGFFGTLFQTDSTLPAALGCPLVGSTSAVSSAYQPFQNGVMIWVASLGAPAQSAIYAVYNNGTYQRFNDTFTEGVDPASGGAQVPAGLVEPVRGFGKVWRDYATVHDTLGWATGGEIGGSAQVLAFDRGEMISVAQAGQTYILITGAPGTWTARAGG